MAQKTRATVVLSQAGVPFTTVRYAYEADSHHIGLHAAAAIGEDASRVLKTLMVSVDGKPACAVVPSDGELSMKRVAAAFGGKSAKMLPPAEAERVTGYHVGGISPFGMRKKVPTAMEEAVFTEASVVTNAGQRGEMVRLAPEDALRVLGAVRAPLLA
ncbi:ybaK/ebsC protein [Solidesulfovibrio fructosivorans JJ]]|uniref:Cys-tRNA(Pro)/Cys-tRNA(Cys) deacylase n=1 Tax=Solidesulfovibrio fructosivorans JJ] TaxID=596151 RepID=E1K0B9_SOLFR|nr:aminoacyl-tRNA deacylase [Solidesulfovibrio fructosivorans]EFL49950.1 ybaK/ebsC protein [Solidesulfovibrio fructosivorans JJ]]